jgi:hypothetical protein
VNWVVAVVDAIAPKLAAHDEVAVDPVIGASCVNVQPGAVTETVVSVVALLQNTWSSTAFPMFCAPLMKASVGELAPS